MTNYIKEEQSLYDWNGKDQDKDRVPKQMGYIKGDKCLGYSDMVSHMCIRKLMCSSTMPWSACLTF